MSREKLRQALRERLEGKVKLEFRHRGASCPACGYVFNNGFSTLVEEGAGSSVAAPETITLCTRCRRPLAVHGESGAIRVIDENGLLLLTEDDRAALDTLRQMLAAAGFDDLA